MLKPITQPYAINVTDWLPDDEFSSYPEGARAKTALFPPENLCLDFIKPSRRYMLKRSAKRYPDQFWGEVVAYQVGCMLGVEVPPAFVAYDENKEYCGALIEWFYEDSEALLVPGGSLLQAIMPTYDRKRGMQHNFNSVTRICRVLSVQGMLGHAWLFYWGEVFLFDALIGNTDRHQENWCFLFTSDKKVHLSPIFDNGTSLGHERFPSLVSNWQEKDFIRYVSKGRHHMKWKIDDSDGCGHIEMIKNITNRNPELAKHLYELISSFPIDQFRRTLQFFETLELPIQFSHERSKFLLKLIELRHQRLCATLHELYRTHH